MKKLIGVVIIMLTLILSVIYRQLSHRTPACGKCVGKLTHSPHGNDVWPSADEPPVHPAKPEQAYVPASLRDGIVMSCLLLQ